MEHIRKDKVFNIPNLLTIVRIALLPVVVQYFERGDKQMAFLVYLIAMATDAADGIIARKFNLITALGKLLDPLADKLSHITLLWLFVADGQIPLWVLWFIVIKEISQVIGGGIALRRGVVVCALPIGKVTTVSFVASIIARFLRFVRLADALLFASVALSVVALVWYGSDLAKKLAATDADSTK